jgi:hypothetical protein
MFGYAKTCFNVTFAVPLYDSKHLGDHYRKAETMQGDEGETIYNFVKSTSRVIVDNDVRGLCYNKTVDG